MKGFTRWTIVSGIVVLMLTVSTLYAHERRKHKIGGDIEAVDTLTNTVTFQGTVGPVTVIVTEHTRIDIDDRNFQTIDQLSNTLNRAHRNNEKLRGRATYFVESMDAIKISVGRH